MFSWCIVFVSVVWLFLTLPRVGIQCVAVVFPDYTHLRFTPCVVIGNSVTAGYVI